jgi:UDP-glucuronate 4-epimerase
MWRDFTYIDDIVEGTLRVLALPPETETPPHRVLNIGNNHPEHLGRFIDILEELLGKKAIRQMEPMQPGDVERTYADVGALEKQTGWRGHTPLREGLERFVGWLENTVPEVGLKSGEE